MDKPLEAQIGDLLTARKLTFAAAESCTGGLILHRMTNIPGSSAYVMGGIVAYSNEAKQKYLHVRAETLERYGAVSSETAEEMVQGVRNSFGVDVALSVTGIAGPGGGTPDKPVGLTYIGLAATKHLEVMSYIWTGDRERNKADSAEAALRMLLNYLKGEKMG